jgi:hypothetical protein
MKAKYVHDICACGCSKLIIPKSIQMDDLYLRCMVSREKSLKVTLQYEENAPLYGWERSKNEKEVYN